MGPKSLMLPLLEALMLQSAGCPKRLPLLGHALLSNGMLVHALCRSSQLGQDLNMLYS